MSIKLEYVIFIAIAATSSLRAYSDRLCGNHTSAAKMSQEQICMKAYMKIMKLIH